MSEIKLLYDVEQLCTDGLKGTGVVRVCDVMLRLLSESDKIDLYPVVTSRRGNFAAYLEAKGLTEKFAAKTVYMPKLKSTTKNQGIYQRLRTKCLTKIYALKYAHILKNYDAYLSMFSPISPVVYGSGLKTFMVVHDLIPIVHPEGCSAKFVKKFTDWIKRSHPDAYFCVSEYTAKDLAEFKPEAAAIPVYTMYLGADNEKFRPIEDKQKIAEVKAKYGIKSAEYFLAVSEITDRKNLVHLLDAYGEFTAQNPDEDVSLVLVGPVRKGYESFTQQVRGWDKIKDKVVLTGFADNEDLAPLYSGAVAFIYPSLYEGFGLPVLEAMQCGTPVITANNTSLPEVGGDAVLYISGHDTAETAELLAKVYTNEKLRETLKAKGLTRAKEFDWHKTSKVMADAIIEELSKKNRK